MDNEVIEKTFYEMTPLEIIDVYFKKEKVQKTYETK